MADLKKYVRRELAKFPTDHILGDCHLMVDFPVVYLEA